MSKKKSFIRRIILFFIVACMAPSLIFTAVFIGQSRSIESERMEESLAALGVEKAAVIQKDLKAIENETVNLALWSGDCVEAAYDGRPLSSAYMRNQDYVFELDPTMAEGRSNVYLPRTVEMNAEIAAEVQNTEKLDRVMESIQQQNKDVTYSYIVTKHGFMRVYPYLANAAFTPDHDQRQDYFYTRAVEQNDPEKKAVWTNPYYDYGGNGWIITCSCPFYVNGELRGVACLDVSLTTLAESIADFSIGSSGFAFIMAENGDVIYHPQMMEEIRTEGERFQLNLMTDGDQPQEYREIIGRMMKEQDGIYTYRDTDNKERIISFTSIDTLNWKLGIEVDKSDYMVGFNYISAGFWLLLFSLLIICIIIGSSMTYKITDPIRALTVDVQKMAAGEFGPVSVHSDDEIGMLAQAFNQMSNEISSYTASLLYRSNQLETVFNCIGGTMMILGMDFRIRMINQEGIRETAGTEDGNEEERREELLGKRCFEVLMKREEPCEGCPVLEAVAEKRERKAELTQNQNVFEISGYPVYGEDGVVEELVVYRRRITEQVMMERELFQSEKMAGVGQMVAGVTHELKNPLSVIKGAAYLLGQVKMTAEKQKETLGEIEANVARAEKIIYNMLDFSRTSWEEKQFSVKSMVEQILLLVRQDLVKRKINFTVELEDESLQIYGNGDSFKHIFLNVITNAIEAMPDGGYLRISGRKISVNRKDEKKSGTVGQESDGGVGADICVPMTEITVCNSGEKIAKENMGRIFEPFFTTKEKGTGLGLWIVSREVSRNSGTVEVFSGEDTQIAIRLPEERIEDETNLNDR